MDTIIILFLGWLARKVFDFALSVFVLLTKTAKARIPFAIVSKRHLCDLELKARSLKELERAYAGIRAAEINVQPKTEASRNQWRN